MPVLENTCCQCRRHRRCGINPWVGKIPWRKEWQPTPVLLPEKCHVQRRLASYIQSMRLQIIGHDWADRHVCQLYHKKPRRKKLCHYGSFEIHTWGNTAILCLLARRNPLNFAIIKPVPLYHYINQRKLFCSLNEVSMQEWLLLFSDLDDTWKWKC